MESHWRKCSSCKKEIPFQSRYWECNVSTCNRNRNPFFFCSVPCWEAHLPLMRHREAWAIDKTSPSQDAWAKEQAAESAKETARAKESAGTGVMPQRRRKVATSGATTTASSEGSELDLSSDDIPKDILIVASKLKKYIKARSGFKTSDTVMAALSNQVRRLCDEAIRNAGRAERITVLDRDIPKNSV